MSSLRAVLGCALLLAVAAAPAAVEASQDANGAMASLSITSEAEPALLSLQAGLEVVEVPLSKALDKLHTASGVPVAYSPSLVPGTHLVTCECSDVSVAEAVSTLLSGTAFEFIVVGEQLIVRQRQTPRVGNPSVALAVADLSEFTVQGPVLPPVPRAPRQGTISGQVLSSQTGQPLGAVQVTIAELGVGTITDGSGGFTLENIPAGTHLLEASLIGYRTASEEVAVQAGEIVEVTLTITQAAIGLDEVVVTGVAGETQRRALGQSLARIGAADIQEIAPVREMQDILQGRAPGAFVRQASGVVGTGAQITIRGQSSLMLGSNPLIYVDGIRVDNTTNEGEPNVSRLEDLNLGEVESIEVIRGPAAATLYGTEAAAGVVQIITRRGQDGAPRFDFTLRQGTMWVHSPADNYWQAMRRLDDGTVESFNLYQRESELGHDPFQYGRIQAYQAQVSGGTDLIRYFASGGFDQDQGFMRPNKRSRLAARTNLSITPTDALTFDLSMGLVSNDMDLVDTRGTIRTVGGALYRGRAHLLDGPTRGWPILTADEMYDTYRQNQVADRFTVSFQTRHQPWDWLEQRLIVGTDFSKVEHTNLVPFTSDEGLRSRLTAAQRDGQVSNSFRDTKNVTFDYGLTGSLEVRDGLTSRTSVGMQYYNRARKVRSASGEGFPAPGLSTVGATAERTSSASFVEVSTVGSFLQQEFHWQNRVFLTAAVRADDNSAFGEDFSWVTYPKASMSWVVSEEDFWDVGWVDQFRLRAAYGASGRQPDAFAALRTFSPRTGTGDRASVTPGAAGNPELKPERGRELEVGFETALFSDRLSVDFTAYTQTTDDVLLSVSNAPSGGFPGNQIMNAGRVNSRGFEVDLMGQVRPSLGLEFNVSRNHNEIDHLGGIDRILRTSHTSGVMDVPGFAPGSHFAPLVVSADLDDDLRATNVMCDGGRGPSGMERGGPAVPCEEAGRVFMGNSVPSWEGTFGATWTPIANLSLRTSFGWVSDVTKFNQNRWVTCTSYVQCEENVHPERFDPTVVANVQLGGAQDLINEFYEDASFLRLREVSALYRLPDDFLGMGTRRTSISVGARNLWTLSSYSGGDPEAMSVGADTVGRIDDMGGVPQPVQLTLTLRAGY